MKHLRRPLSFLCLLLLSGHTLADEEQVLTLGYATFKPYAYKVDGKMHGSLEKAVSAIFQRANLKYAAVELPNKRAKKYLEEFHVDFTVVIKGFITNSEDYWMSEQPIASIQLEAISINDDIPIQQFSDLQHQPLIVLSGYSYGGRKSQLDDQTKFNVSATVENHSAGIKALMAKRGKFLLAYSLPSKEVMQQYDIPFYHYFIDEIPMYLFLRKNLKDSKKFMAKLNAAIAQTTSH